MGPVTIFGWQYIPLMLSLFHSVDPQLFLIVFTWACSCLIGKKGSTSDPLHGVCLWISEGSSRMSDICEVQLRSSLLNHRINQRGRSPEVTEGKGNLCSGSVNHFLQCLGFFVRLMLPLTKEMARARKRYVETKTVKRVSMCLIVHPHSLSSWCAQNVKHYHTDWLLFFINAPIKPKDGDP